MKNHPTESGILAEINGPLRAMSHDFKSTAYVNWEINSPAFHQAVDAWIAAENLRKEAVEKVSAWAKLNGFVGKKFRMIRKCRIDFLVKNGLEAAISMPVKPSVNA